MTSKSVFISAIFLIVFSSLKAQPKDDSYSVDVKGKLDLGAAISLNQISLMKLYKFDPKNHCNQSKALRIVYEDSISKCFDFVRNIGKVSYKKIVALLNLKSTFGNENYACFDTNYALIVYDIHECIIGYIHLSLNCNKAWIFPTTPAFEFYKNQEFMPIGLSASARKQLLGLLKISE